MVRLGLHAFPGALNGLRNTLTTKLLLLGLIPLVVMAAVSLPLTVRGLNQFESDTGNSRLREEVRVIYQQFAQFEARLVATVDRLTADPGLLNAIRQNDIETLRASLIFARFRTDLSYIGIVDTGGQTLHVELNTHFTDVPQAELDRLNGLGLLEIQATKLLPTADGWLLAAVKPVKDEIGLIGAMTIGRLLDDSVLSVLNFDRSDPLLVLFDSQGDLVSAAGSAVQSDIENMFEVDRSLWSEARNRHISLSKADIGGEGHRVAYAALQPGGQSMTVFGLALTTEATGSLRDQLIVTNLVVVGILLLVIFIIAYVVVKIISNPIMRLRDAALQIADGRLDTRVAVTSPDEVGVLANAFNQMPDSVEKMNQTLEERVRDRTEQLEAAQERLVRA